MTVSSTDRLVPLHVPPDWADGAERIRRSDIRMMLVIGAIDTGKSTLCRFLAEQARRSGRSAALLDADLGQKTVGPPACVTMDDPYGMRLAFIGTTDPVLGWTRLIGGIQRLASATDAERIIVNTSGLLTGPGRKLKSAKIGVLRPDLLIALGNGPDLEAILDDHPELPVLRLSPSPEAKRKTDGERRRIRREAFRRYFAGASVRILKRDMLQPWSPNSPITKGLLLGLSDERGNELGLGILMGLPDSTSFEVLTPVTEACIGRVTGGLLCLDESQVHAC